MKIGPVILDGKHVKLVPLTIEHASGLSVAAAYPEIWRWMPFALQSEEQMRGFINTVVKMAETKTALPFTIISKITGDPVGATGYWYIEPHHRRLDIGASWVTPKWQRSAVNTEAKYLLLRHAFEEWQCLRVGFTVDSLNEKSCIALKRIGAKEEGVLRNHMVQPDGRKRHSICFSVIDTEWPEVKARLEELMRPRD
ncbi:MAG: GNAT family protein [Acidobacteriota bacterium]